MTACRMQQNRLAGQRSWDYIFRTFGTLQNAPARNPNCRDDSWKGLILRCVLAKELILDKIGRLEQMNRDTGYNDDAGIDFGEKIGAKALKLDEKFYAEERVLIELLRTNIPSGKIMDALGS
ncbi:hypothetical protein E4T38_06912 [Aureobasidium subglaciale]|nr:hypothetical protein E4T38_06912 [Aureobasidium subglaciale]KAI5218497.1 hypothetical protein E4T40_06843 [Aureobasidium subglaciale]KAI5222180.1 hypothetical protein E4T41_06763 [Aureobasidium subglaciale]KAI5259707.1 hypothetical protein E4T46_06741 [Aureobasidium subglaciale]